MSWKKKVDSNLYTNGEFLEGVLKDAGFVDMQVLPVKLYPGTWAHGKVYTIRDLIVRAQAT